MKNNMDMFATMWTECSIEQENGNDMIG